jgi:hypothetical protein
MSFLNTIFNILRFNRRNWKAVVLCVLAATVFWFFNALNKTYATNINFPLSFAYDNQNFVPVSLLPQHIRLNVTANGWELFKRSTGVKLQPLEIPLERPAEVKKIVGSGLPPVFSNQLAGVKINYVLSDTLYLDLEPKAGRWIKLSVDSIKRNIKPGYGLTSEVAIIPDSTFVVGPQRIINKLEEPVYLKISQRGIDEHYIDNIEVVLPNMEGIMRQPSMVSVMFNVEEMKTVHDSIDLRIVNIPPGVSGVMTAKKIPVTLSIPESYLPGLKMDSVEAVLDLKNFIKGTAKILPRVNGLPPYSAVTKIDSIIVRL